MADSTATQLVVTKENYNNVLDEIDAAFFDIPFENSQFQTENFVIGGSITPERAYRNIGLRMQNRLAALAEAQYGQAKEDIDIEELEFKITEVGETSYEGRRARLDITYKLSNRRFTAKLVNDALCELNILYAHFQAFPHYTRAQFEAGEQLHFDTKLTRQLNHVEGAAEALTNMQQDIKAIENYQEQYKQLLLAGKSFG
jgi:hypothetical protein